MPIFPGEERLVTLFTDCHYYFAQPTARPVLHRFDKASYFYIYWNSTRQTSRLEVANNAGTPDQDAFHGHLDRCRIINSYKFPTLVTLIVDGADSAPSPTASGMGRDPEEWLLASADPRDANQMNYRLHTIDFYFWTQDDAQLVVGFLKQLLDPSQLDVIELKQPAQAQVQQQKRQSTEATLSPVVQNLENIAISDPAYSNGQTRNSQNQAQSQSTSMPPPPPPMPSQLQPNLRATATPSVASQSSISQTSQVDNRRSPQTEKSHVDYTPMAYNPAAPAAPEQIAHREKTPPPPEDGTHGTGLSVAAKHEQVPPSGYKPSQAWGAPPSTSQVSQSSQWGSPPPASSTSGYGPQVASSVGYTSPPPSSQYQQNRSSAGSGIPSSFAPPPMASTPMQDPHRHSVAAETYTPDSHISPDPTVETPGAQFYNTIQQPSKPLQHVQPQYADYLASGSVPAQQPPPGGYSQYSYAHNGQGSHHSHSGHHGSMDYDIHNQVYRPTENEAHSHSKHKSSKLESDIANSKAGKKAKGILKKYF